MGEQSVPKRNGNAGGDDNVGAGQNSPGSAPNDSQPHAPAGGESQNSESDESDFPPEEFEVLNQQLDALNSALDDIENRNDNIHAALLQLLDANREVRQQLQEASTGKNQS